MRSTEDLFSYQKRIIERNKITRNPVAYGSYGVNRNESTAPKYNFEIESRTLGIFGDTNAALYGLIIELNTRDYVYCDSTGGGANGEVRQYKEPLDMCFPFYEIGSIIPVTYRKVKIPGLTAGTQGFPDAPWVTGYFCDYAFMLWCDI